AARGVVRIDAEDRHPQAGEDAVDDLLEDGALVLEVEVESSARDPGRGDDVVDLRGVVPTLREHVARVVEDLLPPLGLVHRSISPESTKRAWPSTSMRKLTRVSGRRQPGESARNRLGAARVRR